MCNQTSTSEDCDHPECHGCETSSAIQLSPEMLHYLTLSVLETTLLLKQIVQNNCKIPHLISTILTHVERIPPEVSRTRSVVLPVHVIHGLITHPEVYKFAYTLELESDFQEHLYKGSAFEVILRLLSSDRSPIGDLVGSRYRALLYTDEVDLKPVQANLLGRKSLGGTTEAVCGSDASVRFPSLIINEVSSHCANNTLSLVVVCLGSSKVRPYVKKNLSVKPRRGRGGKQRPVAVT